MAALWLLCLLIRVFRTISCSRDSEDNYAHPPNQMQVFSRQNSFPPSTILDNHQPAMCLFNWTSTEVGGSMVKGLEPSKTMQVHLFPAKAEGLYFPLQRSAMSIEDNTPDTCAPDEF